MGSEAFLGINLSYRSLMLSTDQFPPPDSFRFCFKGAYGPFSVEIPCAIIPLDEGPVRDPVDIPISILLAVRAVPSVEDKSTVIEDQQSQQIGIIAALQEAKAINYHTASVYDTRGIEPSASAIATDTSADTDPEETSYLDNTEALRLADEISRSRDLIVAKTGLGGMYGTGTSLPEPTT